ncbi:MAG TPA: hypothetical protein O0X97_04755 [Methanocorpusculum sp.]|nr:hypothetical protein [Methanocorpusculum sp.]
MKSKAALVLAACILLSGIIISAGCISTSEDAGTTEEPSLFGSWVLKSDTNITLTIEKDGSYGGKAQLNHYGGTHSYSGTETEQCGLLNFTSLIHTLPDESARYADTETGYDRSFHPVSYTISHPESSLINSTNHRLIYVYETTGVMNAENAFFAAFPRTAYYVISDSELSLADEYGNTLLTFIKV